MGVPKFYRWLSERYPCLSQVIKEHQIPEFDNLYLDMNGIIHPCSHPNDDDPHFRITEAQIFKNIFNYIEVLFRIIKPKKHFFMAVDGCAPRAKMNQQRSRRFRTAKEAEDSIRKAIQKGQTLPKEDRFDSNCITPGTEFMARLQEQLKYFVNKKISSDPLWQECTVYLSGHDVPGEGEHKIMDFIRYCKAEPTYDPNTRHCLYGLDADLLMLGLTTHEPYFCLLREEVRFGKQAKRLIRPEEQTFHLLHLTLLREYIDLEFGSLKDELHFNYDGERIIDDWVLLGFLVGNDFVPHLPNMHINHDALPYIYRIYKEFLVTADGYLNDGGTINLPRLKKFLRALSVFDRERFEDVYSDLKWLESKGSGKLLSNSKPTQSKKKFSELMKELTLDELEEDLRDLQKQAFHEANPYLALDDENSSSKEEDVEVEDEETFELEFKQHKRQYYMEKFDMDIADDEHINTICREYVIALQWISHYYFNGLQSWSWYYPYHYSPYISDVANFDLKEITLDMGSPFHPFEQLLAVLPAASRKLLPQAFQSLMVVDNSAIIDYYPSDFRTDLNGKQQDWEAVVLIPFIDEKRLLAAMEQHYALLTDEEKIRNSFGTFFEYTHDRALNFNYPSPHTEFEDLVSCHAKVVSQHMDLHRIDPARINKGLLKGTRLDTYYHGFPTMKHLQHEAYLEKAAVKVFQHQSRTLNTIIRIAPPKISDIGEVAKQLVGEIVYVEWPYMVEAMVTSVSNDAQKYFLGKQNELTSKMVQNHDYSIFKRELKAVTTYHMERRGINLGDVKILVQAKLLLGQRYNCGEKNTVKVEKEWSQNTNFYPLQTVVKELPVHEQTKEVFDSVSSLFPPHTVCFMLADLHYGCSGEVIEFDKQTGRVRVALTTEDEPSFEDIMQKYDSLSVHYLSDKAVAQRLGITTHLLGRITGNVFIEMSNEEQRNNSNLINVGLKLKYSGQNKEVLGYARRSAQGWTYSPATVAVIGKYMQEFPDLFEALGWATGKDNYNINTLLPGKKRKYMDQVVGFLKKQSCYNSNLVRCGSTALDEPVVQALEQCIDQHKESLENKVVKVKVKPHLLFRPTQMFGKLSPDPGTKFLLLDRVVNVQKGVTVPLGMRGTVIGLHEVLSDEQDKNSATESRYEILFDEPFLGALKRRSKENRGYFMSGNSLLNVSYGERKVKEKSSTQLTSAMMFQSKISHSPVSAKLAQIPNSPSTPGIIRTPKNYNTPNSPYSPKSGGDWRQNYNRGHSSRDNTPQYTPTSSRDNTPQYTPTSSKYTPKQHQQKYTPQSRYDQSNNRYEQSNNCYDQSNSRYGSGGGGGGGSGGYQNKRAPQLTPKNLAQTNNDFMSMWQKAEQNQKEKSEKVDENATAIVKELIHMPNKSPKDSQQPPQQQSAATNLHQWCVAFNLPLPQYMYSESSQGVSAAVLIGQMLRIDGDDSPNKNVAAESAATAALNHLLQMNPFSAMPAPPLSPFQPGPIMMFPPPPFQQFMSPPHQFQRGGPRPHQRYNNSPQHQQNRDYTSRKNKPASNMDSERQNRNMFVPHQVLVKNKSPAQPQDDSTAAELKSMLGIVSSEQPTASSASSASSQHLKHLLGINQTSTEDVNSSVTKKANSEDEEALKKLFGIGLKPEIQEKIESTSTVEAGEIEISSATTASSVVTPSTTPLTPSSPIPSLTPSQSLSDNSTTSTTTDSNQKPKKKIQLATSFLGPKKK